MTKKHLMERVCDILSGAVGSDCTDPDAELNMLLSGEERQRWALAMNAVFFGVEKAKYGFDIGDLDSLDSARDATEALWSWRENFGNEEESA